MRTFKGFPVAVAALVACIPSLAQAQSGVSQARALEASTATLQEKAEFFLSSFSDADQAQLDRIKLLAASALQFRAAVQSGAGFGIQLAQVNCQFEAVSSGFSPVSSSIVFGYFDSKGFRSDDVVSTMAQVRSFFGFGGGSCGGFGGGGGPIPGPGPIDPPAPVIVTRVFNPPAETLYSCASIGFGRSDCGVPESFRQDSQRFPQLAAYEILEAEKTSVQSKKNKCESKGSDWDYSPRSVWTDKGCRATFRVIPRKLESRSFRCRSEHHNPKDCPVPGFRITGIELTKQQSTWSTCSFPESFNVVPGGMRVTAGCDGDFTVYGYSE
jgi:hypothetical protein